MHHDLGQSANIASLVSLPKHQNNQVSMAQIQGIDQAQDGENKAISDEDMIAATKNPKQRLTEVKDVLKNSKTLKEQLKGVCACYDDFVTVQGAKEDQKSLSLMKNFFLQIVNKS
jgi:hypothetical protein